MDIKLSLLDLDVSNYRTGPQKSQAEEINALIKDQHSKLAVLAKDILDHGLNPLEFMAAMEHPTEPGRYIVLEGNRRVAAMKLVIQPDLAKDTSVHSAFKKLHKRMGQLPSKLPFQIFKDKDEVSLWIERRHDIGQKGAGMEPWSAMAKMRAAADQGEYTASHDVLAFALDKGIVTPQVAQRINEHDFNVSTLDRLLKSSTVREMLKIKEGDGHLEANASEEWTKEALGKIITAIATSEFEGEPFGVSNVYTIAKQKKFISKVLGTDKNPKPVKTWQVGVTSGQAKIKKAAKGGKAKANITTAGRKTLASPSTPVMPPAGRPNNVLEEMTKISVSKFPNGGAVLLRVFIEFSADAYIGKKGINPTSDKLVKKLQTICQDMITSKIVKNAKELAPIQKMCSDPTSLFSTATLNAYVHNDKMFPSPEELKVSWDNLEHFLELVWLNS